MSDQKEIKYVRWSIFCWVISIFIVVMGWVFVRVSAAENKMDNTNVNMMEIKTQLAGISADLIWIKENIKK
jgi:multidrug efflux pump subunit AcrB